MLIRFVKLHFSSLPPSFLPSLLILVRESGLLPERRLAEVLHPAVLAQEGGGQAEREAQLEREAVDARGQQDRLAAWKKKNGSTERN